MSRRSVRMMILVLVALVAFQLAWHVCLDHSSAATDALRGAYLHKTRHGKSNGLFLDVIIPAAAAGIAFGRAVRDSTRADRVVLACTTGVVLTTLQFLHPSLVEYDLWWLAPELNGRWSTVR